MEIAFTPVTGEFCAQTHETYDVHDYYWCFVSVDAASIASYRGDEEEKGVLAVLCSNGCCKVIKCQCCKVLLLVADCMRPDACSTYLMDSTARVGIPMWWRSGRTREQLKEDALVELARQEGLWK